MKNVYKNLFLPIIQYSDVGIDSDAEEEMETIQAFGRQAIEEEIEMDNPDEQDDDDTALQVRLPLELAGFDASLGSSSITNSYRQNWSKWRKSTRASKRTVNRSTN